MIFKQFTIIGLMSMRNIDPMSLLSSNMTKHTGEYLKSSLTCVCYLWCKHSTSYVSSLSVGDAAEDNLQSISLPAVCHSTPPLAHTHVRSRPHIHTDSPTHYLEYPRQWHTIHTLKEAMVVEKDAQTKKTQMPKYKIAHTIHWKKCTFPPYISFTKQWYISLKML